MRFPSRIKVVLIAFPLVSLALLFYWIFQLNQTVNQRLKKGWFPPSLSFYSDGTNITSHQGTSLDHVIRLLKSLNFRKRSSTQKLLNSDYALFNSEECHSLLGNQQDIFFDQCLVFRMNKGKNQGVLHVISFFEKKSAQIYYNEPPQIAPSIELPPLKLFNLVGEKPILRERVKISHTPLYCLQAITAIEDGYFLQHHGFSLKGIARAVVKNLLKGRMAEGGSTITQQLIKNYFLTHERTLKRKFNELLLSLIIESQYTKDQILEAYLNVIYMGQQGSFEVRGYATAAQFYFNKPLNQLDLGECSALAAIVNSPGLYNPFRFPERTIQRQQLVLKKMVEHKMITPQQSQLPHKTLFASKKIKTSTYPYFQNAVLHKIKELDLPEPEFDRHLYTTLDPFLQTQAQLAVSQELDSLREKNNLPQLQALLVAIEVKTGKVKALIGGKNFKEAPYNRAIESKRQIGSLMKPIVYLTALGQPEFTPMTLIEDTPFTHKFDGQTWTPSNYDKKFMGSIPLFYALKNSRNVPAAKVALEVGLSQVINLAKTIGLTTPLKPLPSLSLGSFESTPLDIATAYLTIARAGNKIQPYFLSQLYDGTKKLFSAPLSSQQVLPQEQVWSLISILHQVTQTGTARSLSTWRNFPPLLAGKTGTTNQSKDNWFVGFSPDLLTAVWVGNDDASPTSLTGSSSALPLWARFMKSALTRYPQHGHMDWPENLDSINLSIEELYQLVPDLKPHEAKSTFLLLPNKNEVQDEN